MDWESHNDWAEKIGVPREVSQYVNRIIDAEHPSEHPDDFSKAAAQYAEAKAAKDGAKKGNSALPLVIKRHIQETHDKGRGSKTADSMTGEMTVSFLKKKGDTYLAAYYLHHHLDYLSENRNTGKSLKEILEAHRKSSRPYNQSIADTLLNHEEDLVQELGL